MWSYTDPATGRLYTVDPVTGESRWLDEVTAPTAPALDPAEEAAEEARLAALRSSAIQAPRRRRAAPMIILAVGVAVVLVIAAVSWLSGRTSGTMAARASASSAGAGPAPSATAAPAPSPESAAASPTVQEDSMTAPEPSVTLPAARIGATVRDGVFTFRVTGTRRVKQLSNAAGSATADGMFQLVDLAVRNVSGKPQTFSATCQRLYDTLGSVYDADPNAEQYLDDAGLSLNQQVARGETVAVTLVFGVPTDAVADRVELHDTPVSAGTVERVR